MRNLIGVIVSFTYFFGLLIISRYLPIKSLEGKRKFVHIMLGNWWIMVIYFFSDVICAAIVPFSFIFINYASLKRGKGNGLLSSLEREQKSLGIVLYPVAMVILVLVSFIIFKDIRVGGIGLIALSYGDGMAALIGKHYNFAPFYVFGNKKSLSGCVAMYVATFFMVYIYIVITNLSGPKEALLCSCFIALVSALAEICTPFGIDNISVPLLALFTYYIFSMHIFESCVPIFIAG